MDIMKVSQQDLQVLKREVKKRTGLAKCSVSIEAYGDNSIEYSFYKTKHDRLTNNKTIAEIIRIRD